MKSISVIIPTYNEEAYIRDCLKALTSQTHKPDEIIVVDNNSTDSTVKIVKTFRGVKLMFEKKQGQLYARTVGFNAAKSELLATIDADSLPDSDWIEKMLEFQEANESEAFSGYIHARHVVFSRTLEFFGNVAIFGFTRLASGKNFMLGANLFISKKLWLKIRKGLRPRTDLWEDLELSLLAYQAGHEVHINKQPHLIMSGRALGDLSMSHLYRRMLGGPKTYWPFSKPAACVFFVLIHVSVILFALAKLFLGHTYKPKGNYEGW